MAILSLIGNWFTSWVIGWGGIGALIAIGSWALWYFTPPFLSGSKTTILHVATISTAITIAGTYLFTNGYNTGYKVAINQVAAKNKEASDAVKKAITKVDECNNRGGTWDTVNGVCQ